MKGNKSRRSNVNCFKCKHFYITWDKNFPRGCRALNFKSQNVPSQVVFQSSGFPCLCFEKKVRGIKR